MAIKTSCSCGFSFNAKDSLSGKRVKCPRCSKPLQIPQKNAVAVGASAGGNTGSPVARRKVNKSFLDMLDEEGVEGIPQGPICQSCGQVMSANSIICVNCGFNATTGEFLETQIDDDGNRLDSDEKTADQLLAKAEQEIDESPVSAVNQDFGDGADSYVIALGAMAFAGILILVGLAVVLFMEHMTSEIGAATIGFYVSIGVFLVSHLAITIAAFLDSLGKGILSLLFAPYAIFYGFSKRTFFTMMPAAMMVFALPMMIISPLLQ